MSWTLHAKSSTLERMKVLISKASFARHTMRSFSLPRPIIPLPFLCSSHHFPLFISPSSSIHLTLHHVCLATGKPHKLTECLYTYEHIQMQVKRLTEYESLYAHEREEKLLLESKMIQRASELQEVLLVNRRLPEYSSFSLYLIILEQDVDYAFPISHLLFILKIKFIFNAHV